MKLKNSKGKTLNNGNIISPGTGGARENAGRKTDEFKEMCRRVSDSPKFFAWAKRVIDGEIMERRITRDGEIVSVPVSVSDRMMVWEKISAYPHGKPAQALGVQGDGVSDLLSSVDALRKERGLT